MSHSESDRTTIGAILTRDPYVINVGTVGIKGDIGFTGSRGLQSVIPPSVTANSVYTLTTADVGKFVEVVAGGSIVIPNTTFAAGDVVTVFNNTSDTATISCSINTAYIAGINTDRATVSISTRGLATVLFANSTNAVLSGSVL